MITRIYITADGLLDHERGDFPPVPKIHRVIHKKLKRWTEAEMQPETSEQVSREYELIHHNAKVLIYEEII